MMKVPASPRVPSRGFTAANRLMTPPPADATRDTLPTLTSGRGQSPNVAKRTGWTTPRSAVEFASSTSSPPPQPPGGAVGEQLEDLDDLIASVQVIEQQQQERRRVPTPRSGVDTTSMEAAVEILEAIVRENALQSATLHHRASLLQRTDALQSSEAKERESQQLAYLEHMYTTVQLLQKDLERERCRSGSCHNNVGDLDAAATEALRGSTAASFAGPSSGTSAVKSNVKRATELPARLLHSPLLGRLGNGPTAAQENALVDLQKALEKNANSRIRARVAEKSAFEREVRERELAQRGEWLADKQVPAREQKLREALDERAYWQREYEAMRDQVVVEKTRQVELFRRLEKSKSDCLRRTDELERALRECSMEVELLRSQLAETQVCAAQQKRAMDELAKSAKEEKDRLVCSIAETRHKFKEWKEGEAGTLKAARDQAVHNLKTEYELKIARHHEEKQKLRDKVKDLEVSLRLLQKDRHLSPVELSLRKATILGSKEGGSTTTEAELIEANCRNKELEVLLNHAKEHQKRQEHIIRVSESTMSRLMQEREVVALENLTLQPLASLQAGSLALAKVVDPIGSVSMGPSGARHSDVVPPTHPASPGTATAAATTGAFSFDGAMASEKEILRRQSVVLSAEVEKYRQIVVHSLDEIRSLKDSRRRSVTPGTPNGNATTLKEQYLMGEVIRLQGELEAVTTSQKKQGRKAKKRAEKGVAGVSNDDGSSSNRDSSGSDSDAESSSSERKEPPRLAQARVFVRKDEGEDTEEGDPRDETQQDPKCPRDQQSATFETANVSPSFPVSSITGLAPLEPPPEGMSTESREKEAAVKVIQNKSKAFLLRRDFIKRKIAVGKIKARYRGYLVRKNVELLDRHQKQLVVSQAAQYKMEIVDAHHEMTCKCHGLLLKLVIRVSKDPPIVQILMAPAKQPGPSPTDPLSRFDAPMHDEFRDAHVTYIHLFEIVALLPHEEESEILEKATEKEIAESFAPLLSVVRVGGQYKFAIRKKPSEGSADPHDHIVHFGCSPSGDSVLNELPVEKMPEKDAPRQTSSEQDSADDARELEDLIRKARVPLADNAVKVDFDDFSAEISSRADHVHLKKFLRRLSSSSPDIVHESPHSSGGPPPQLT